MELLRLFAVLGLALIPGLFGFGTFTTSPQTSLTLYSTSSVNIDLDNVKNMRDMTTAYEKMLGSKIIRTGCVSKASDTDISYMKENIDFKVLIDLRSPAEIEEDDKINSSVYDGFCSYQYSKTHKGFEVKDEKDLINTDGTRRRYFISLMSESLIKKGVFFRLRKRMRFKAIGLYLLSILSRRAEKKVREIFIDKINGGGLSLLNELVIDASGHEIVAVLKLTADPANYPLGMYCTAGKDRTGLIGMLILATLGATDEQILADYVLSDSAYKKIGDKKAMVAALAQTDVDPDTFLRAQPHVMTDTMDYIRSTFGSTDAFLDEYGFDESWRDTLRKNLMA